MMDSIHLADLPFYTIQGEGASSGRPAFFIRVQSCSVGCDFCDTKYSWSESISRGHLVLYSDIQKALALIPSSAVIVITGGEPFERIKELCSFLDNVDCGLHEIECETSGYIFDRELLSIIDRVTLSPKILPSAMVKEDKRMSAEVAAQWKAYAYGTDFVTWKFVIKDQADIAALLPIVQEWKLPAKDIYLMPEAITAEQNLERGRWLVEQCKELGFNFSPRLHIWLWGARRGV